MSAAAADLRVKSVFQTHDEIIAAAIACRLFHLGVRRIGSAHADIFSHGVVKQEVILRHISNELVVMLCGNAADVRAAHGDAAAAHIPEGGDELGNGGFAAAGGTDQRVDRSFREDQVNAVQHLGVIVAKVNVTQLHGAALRRFCVRFGARQLRGG